MQPMPIDSNVQLNVSWFPILALIVGAVIAGIVFAIRHGYGKVVLGIGVASLIIIPLVTGLAFTVRVQSSPTASDHMISHTMQSPPQVAVQTNGRLLGAISIGLMAVIGGYMILHGQWKALAIGGGTLVALAVIVLPSVQQVREAERRAHQVNDLKQLGQQLHARHDAAMAPAAAQAPTPTGPTPSQILYITGNAQPITIPELPNWRKNPPREGSTESGYAKYVLTSEQFATVEEAEAQLFQTLTADVQRGFAHHWPQTTGWVPTREDITQSGLIPEKVIETMTVKVGEFENPVHRVSWLVEFRPEANQALHARWYPLEAQRRAKLILSILAGVSGVLGISAIALRRSRNQPSPA